MNIWTFNFEKKKIWSCLYKVGSGSIFLSYGAKDPDRDPHQNKMESKPCTTYLSPVPPVPVFPPNENAILPGSGKNAAINSLKVYFYTDKKYQRQYVYKIKDSLIIS